MQYMFYCRNIIIIISTGKLLYFVVENIIACVNTLKGLEFNYQILVQGNQFLETATNNTFKKITNNIN